MATAPSTPATLPEAPDYVNSRADSNAKATAWAKALPTLSSDLKSLADGAYANALDAAAQATAAAASAVAAQASSNYAGLWSSLTGAKTHGTVVYHSGEFYLLLSDVADVTTQTPGVSSNWARITPPSAALRSMFFA